METKYFITNDTVSFANTTDIKLAISIADAIKGIVFLVHGDENLTIYSYKDKISTTDTTKQSILENELMNLIHDIIDISNDMMKDYINNNLKEIQQRTY